MREAFDPGARSVLVPVTLSGLLQVYEFTFAVDTASTKTSIRPDFLRTLGYDLARPVERKRIRSATGTTIVPVYRVALVAALGQTRTDFLVATQELPLGVEADGLFGLDFFRGLVLTLDFARGLIALRPPRRW